MAYSAYHPHASRSEALRPNGGFSQSNAYTPINEHDAPSPVDSRSNPFASHNDYSSDSLNRPYYGAGTGGFGAGESAHRAYGDEIPLRYQPSSPKYETPSPVDTDPKKTAFASESALTADEAAREERRRRRRRREREKQREKGIFGIGTGRISWVVYFLTLVQVTVFIAEIVKNAVLTGTPIEIHPSFNPMIGPSPYVQINLGARFLPCMKDETANLVTPDLPWPCPNATSIGAESNVCTLAELCGNGAGTDEFPIYQWWRFITPIFLHAGIIHIGFNMLLQMTLGREIERLIGSVRFFFVYFAAGIFGFILGGNFAAKGLISTGASGSLFGILGINLLDLLYTWPQRRSPGKELIFVLLDIVISLVLGLLPGLDNFSHIGGLLVGLVLGVCILRSPDVLRRRTTSKYDPNNDSSKTVDNKGRVRAKAADYSSFAKDPAGFFKNRNPFWWGWWLVRAGTLIAIIVSFIVLIRNFYIYNDQCSWCKYLSCLPITTNGVNWCDIGTAFVTNSSSNTNSNPLKRNIMGVDLLGYF